MLFKEKPSLGKPPAACLSCHSLEQLYQPFFQVFLGSIQVVQVSKHLLVTLFPVCHQLAEFAVILLGFCCSFFKFLLGPGGGEVSLPDCQLHEPPQSLRADPDLHCWATVLQPFPLHRREPLSATCSQAIAPLTLKTSSHTQTLHTHHSPPFPKPITRGIL